MSIFNRPYKTDEQLEHDTYERRRKEKYDQRRMELTIANEIYDAVIDGIERGGKKKWTKPEMIETVRGKGKFNNGEWDVWCKYCNRAISKIRRRYWSTNNPADQKMFNYVRYEQTYYLIDIDDALRSNIVYGEYNRKMRSLQEKNKQLKESVYVTVLKFNEVERDSLIKQLREGEIV